MADDDAAIDEETDGEDEELDDDLEGPDDDLDDDDVVVDEDADDDDTADDDEDDEDEDDDDRSARARKRKGDEDDDEDDDMLAPDDVEADLDEILKDRMVASDDDDDDDDDEVPAAKGDVRAERPDGLQPKREDEQLCSRCFLLVRANAPGCPIEDDNCPIFS
jgi:hypothetical protein